MIIRTEQPGDYAAIHSINLEAFESPAEAKLVQALRVTAEPVISLVAELNGAIVGHILLSPVTLSGSPSLKLMGLAPMAVTDAHQAQGIGSKLIEAALTQCRQLGIEAVVVLGHPGYYPRFGFTPSTDFGINCEYDVPAEVFMVLELEPSVLADHRGQIRYHPAFNAL